MSKRALFAMIGVVCFLVGLLAGQQASHLYAQPNNAKAPVWRLGLDLKARQGGTDDFEKARKYGVEVFLDVNTNNLVYISETGSIAVVPNK
jgi:imidazolonepropionase-like amidohydrolase